MIPLENSAVCPFPTPGNGENGQMDVLGLDSLLGRR